MINCIPELTEYLKALPNPLTRVSIIEGNGEPETIELSPANPCQNVYSVAKTYTMTAIGLCFDKGLLKPEDRIVDIFNEEFPETGADKRWELVTIDLLLRHSAGLPGGFLDIDCHKSSEFTADFLNYMFTYPLDYTPGTEARYSDGAFYLLGRVVTKLTGEPVDKFMWEEMLTDLDYQEIAWSKCPKGFVIGASGLYVHTADMAKLGAVYLNGGCYKGRRCLSEEWVSLVKEKNYGVDWDENHRYFYKGGMRGQKLIIYPNQNITVAVQSFCGDSGAVEKWFAERE